MNPGVVQKEDLEAKRKAIFDQVNSLAGFGEKQTTLLGAAKHELRYVDRVNSCMCVYAGYRLCVACSQGCFAFAHVILTTHVAQRGVSAAYCARETPKS